MAENTKIQWTDHTFNPWRGCTKVHTGCANCYAETTSKQNPKILGKWGPNGTRVVAADAIWRDPIKWDRAAAKAGERHRVFCASLADVFEDWQGPMIDHYGRRLGNCPKCKAKFSATHKAEWDHGAPEYFCFLGAGGCGEDIRPTWSTMHDVRQRLFALIDSTPNLDWMLLTKRPENVRKFWPAVNVQSQEQADDRNERGELYRRNVWLGTSISDQETFDKWTAELFKLRDLSPVLFLSAEPLVGPVDLLYPSSMFPDGPRKCCNGMECGCRGMPIDPWMLWGIDLVIVGGESGYGARPCNVEWVRSIVKDCAEAGVACFVKQLGSNGVVDEGGQHDWPSGVYFDGPEDHEHDRPLSIVLRDKKGGNIDEWPADIRVRQMPAGHVVKLTDAQVRELGRAFSE